MRTPISVWGDAGIVAPLATAIAPLLSGAFEKYEACPHCEQLPAKLKFRHVDASVFMSFHSKLCEDVARGVLRVESGDLQWSDIIKCTIRCAHCGTRFQLVCETYHGSGGEWHVEPSGIKRATAGTEVGLDFNVRLADNNLKA